jgi:hypothetical protein
MHNDIIFLLHTVSNQKITLCNFLLYLDLLYFIKLSEYILSELTAIVYNTAGTKIVYLKPEDENPFGKLMGSFRKPWADV